MRRRSVPRLMLGAAMLFVSVGIESRDVGPPATGVAPVPEQEDFPAPTNLRILPKDISRAGLRALMKRYERELGVTCAYCHVEDSQTGRFDYASDENPKKDAARVMMSMLKDINTKYLGQLGDPRYLSHITCGNCHRGQKDPPDYEGGNASRGDAPGASQLGAQ